MQKVLRLGGSQRLEVIDYVSCMTVVASSLRDGVVSTEMDVTMHSHTCLSAFHGHLCGTSQSLPWASVWHIPVSSMGICVAHPSLFHGHLCGTSQSHPWASVWHIPVSSMGICMAHHSLFHGHLSVLNVPVSSMNICMACPSLFHEYLYDMSQSLPWTSVWHLLVSSVNICMASPSLFREHLYGIS